MNSLSLLFYNLSLAIYSFVVSSISPFHQKAKAWSEGRKTVWDELQKLPPVENRIWFHCSSLGEYEQALPLIEKLKATAEIVVTFFSPSGYEVVKRKNPEALIFYLPVDTAANAKKFLDIVKPQLAVFVRYDLWYHYLHEMKERNIKSILISAVFRQQHIFFKWYGSLFKLMLHKFTHVFVQDEESKDVLHKNGFQNVTKAGDTRVDRVLSILNEGKQFPLVEQFKGQHKLFIVGSLEPKDEDIVLPAINKAENTNLKFVIAPHHIDKATIEKIQKKLEHKSLLYSSATTENIATARVLIIDSIGMLSRLYAYADVAYIGGGFGEGLHNILEPAVWGVPVIFGPKYYKFVEAVELVKRKGAFEINSFEDLAALMSSSASIGNEAGEIVKNYIRERSGATESIYNWLQSKDAV